MKICYKFWLENEKGKAFGNGPFGMLNSVQEAGSLKQAAFGIKMSYLKAKSSLMKIL